MDRPSLFKTKYFQKYTTRRPDELELKSMEGETTRYRRARPWAPSPAELSGFTGRYQSDEIGAVFQIEAGDGGEGRRVAGLEHAPDRTVQLTPVDPDTFILSRISDHRDEAGAVVGFDYSNPVVRNIPFTLLSDRAAGAPAGG